MTSISIRVLRGTRIFLHILQAIAVSAFLFPFYQRHQRENWLAGWSKQLLRIFNIDFQVIGDLPKQVNSGHLIVSNHVSWLDIHLIHAVFPARFIAKSEIRQWPIFGWLAAKNGTLFLQRKSNKGAAAMVKVATNSLRNGDLVACFPEGTTSDGHTLLPFHGSLLQASIDAGSDIVPICIRYLDAQGKPDIRMAFLDEMTLVESIVSILRVSHGQAELQVLKPISSHGHDRRGLTVAVQHAIATHLKSLQSID